MSETRIIYVSAGVLLRPDNSLLLATRPSGKSMAGLWELPGGKIEPGETPESALIREMGEELAVTLKRDDLSPLTFASHGYDSFHLVMPVFLARNWEGEPVPQEGQDLAWVKPGALKTMPAPAADVPLFDFLERHLTKHVGA
ncbi:(deoxy)nucleoside triphosphate pyrophosphohydrolase [Ponticaulis profundi]|uniref:8-oxo-dGTP diphosphatase n=1 Tax=Ponticaulis profundi TaxID=2665222 RepID=A0ABW1SCC6_9PROT